MWNTGCAIVHNRTSAIINITDAEDPWRKLALAGGQSRSFSGTIFPWCSNADEVRNKAFLFRSGNASTGLGLFYMFQDYANNTVSWTPYDGGHPSWDARTAAGAPPSSYVDVVVDGDAGSPNSITPSTIGLW